MTNGHKYDVLIIGGGAAGMLAAGCASQSGADTLLVEKKSTLGRKLAITGKGRCNLTNSAELAEFIKHFGRNGKFLRPAFSQFFSHDLVDLLNSLGVPTDVERGGRIFPVSEQAPDVVRALNQWVRQSGVEILTGISIADLKLTNGHIIGVETDDGNAISAKTVIIATGGLSYPATGSTGDGYRLAQSVGHTIIPTRPALVPLNTADDIAPRLQGLSLKNVSAGMWLNGRKQAELFGEMLFTHFGLSGPIVLTLSREFVNARKSDPNGELILAIDLKPALDPGKLDDRLLRDLDANGKKKFHTVIKGLVPGKLADLLPELIDVDPDKLCHQITSEERRRLRNILKRFEFKIKGPRSIKEAIVTAGGVSLKEVDPKTMQSKIVPGLFLSGEVLDIDGDTGGFNLQAAFSTGWLAGRAAAQFARS